jgi:hypothetical protein
MATMRRVASSYTLGMLDKERLKVWENHVGDMTMQHTKGNSAIHPFGWRPLPEAYAKGKQGIHVRFRIEVLSESGGSRGIRRNLCAVFKRAQVDSDNAREVGCVRRVGVGLNSNLRDVRYSMFVHVGQLVELPEGVRCVFIPLVVRLQPLDNRLRVWVDAPDSLLAGTRTHGFRAKDGEL